MESEKADSAFSDIFSNHGSWPEHQANSNNALQNDTPEDVNSDNRRSTNSPQQNWPRHQPLRITPLSVPSSDRSERSRERMSNGGRPRPSGSLGGKSMSLKDVSKQLTLSKKPSKASSEVQNTEQPDQLRSTSIPRSNSISKPKTPLSKTYRLGHPLVPVRAKTTIVQSRDIKAAAVVAAMSISNAKDDIDVSNYSTRALQTNPFLDQKPPIVPKSQTQSKSNSRRTSNNCSRQNSNNTTNMTASFGQDWANFDQPSASTSIPVSNRSSRPSSRGVSNRNSRQISPVSSPIEALAEESGKIPHERLPMDPWASVTKLDDLQDKEDKEACKKETKLSKLDIRKRSRTKSTGYNSDGCQIQAKTNPFAPFEEVQSEIQPRPQRIVSPSELIDETLDNEHELWTTEIENETQTQEYTQPIGQHPERDDDDNEVEIQVQKEDEAMASQNEIEHDFDFEPFDQTFGPTATEDIIPTISESERSCSVDYQVEDLDILSEDNPFRFDDLAQDNSEVLKPQDIEIEPIPEPEPKQKEIPLEISELQTQAVTAQNRPATEPTVRKKNLLTTITGKLKILPTKPPLQPKSTRHYQEQNTIIKERHHQKISQQHSLLTTITGELRRPPKASNKGIVSNSVRFRDFDPEKDIQRQTHEVQENQDPTKEAPRIPEERYDEDAVTIVLPSENLQEKENESIEEAPAKKKPKKKSKKSKKSKKYKVVNTSSGLSDSDSDEQPAPEKVTQSQKIETESRTETQSVHVSTQTIQENTESTTSSSECVKKLKDQEDLVKTLQNQLNSAKNLSESLQKALDEKIDILTEFKNQILSENSFLKQEKEELKHKIQKLESKNEFLLKENHKLDKSNSSLAMKMDGVENERRVNEMELFNTKNELAELDRRCGALESHKNLFDTVKDTLKGKKQVKQ